MSDAVRKPAQAVPSQSGGRLAPPVRGSQDSGLGTQAPGQPAAPSGNDNSPNLPGAVPVLPRAPETMQGTSPAPLWDCKFTKASDGPELTALSVGAKFILHCEGGVAIPPWTAVPPLGFEKPEDEFSLSVLSIQNAGPNSADLVVTGYKAGNYSGLKTIGVGANQIQVSDLKWSMPTSVKPQEGQEQQQPPKPFPPYGPLVIHWPWWLWTGIGVFIFLVAVAIWWRVRRHMARKRLLEKIKAHGSVLSAYAQLHKDLRALLRRYEGFSKPDEQNKPEDYLSKLNESFRNYLSRALLVPATEWSDTAIARDIKKRHKALYKQHGTEIYAFLRELKRAQNSKRLTFTDCTQLHEMGRKLAEKIESHKGDKS